MKLPDKIKIGPHIYKIKYEEHFSSNHGALAHSRHALLEIVVDPLQEESQIFDTIIHEALHCINRQTEYVEQERDAEEKAVNRLSPAILSLIKENKHIFENI